MFAGTINRKDNVPLLEWVSVDQYESCFETVIDFRTDFYLANVSDGKKIEALRALVLKTELDNEIQSTNPTDSLVKKPKNRL